MVAPVKAQSKGDVAVLLYGLKYDGTVLDWHVSATPKLSPPRSNVTSSSPPGMNGVTACFVPATNRKKWNKVITPRQDAWVVL